MNDEQQRQEKSMPAVELCYVKKIADRLHRALDRFVDGEDVRSEVISAGCMVLAYLDELTRRNGGTDG